MPKYEPPPRRGAGESTKGLHPDLTEDGELRADVYQDTPRRDFNRMAADPDRWQAFMERVARQQAELDPWVQQQIAGRSFGAANDPYDGFQAYEREKRLLEDTLGSERSISSADVEKMDQSEYEQYFDPDRGGAPRKGVRFRPSRGRDVDLTDTGLDRYSARELGR